jgi:hypothetical protein
MSWVWQEALHWRVLTALCIVVVLAHDFFTVGSCTGVYPVVPYV